MEQTKNRTGNSALQAQRDPVSPQPRIGRSTIAQTCATCNSEFQALESEVKRGNGKYCSLSCSSRSPTRIKAKQPNTVCGFCNAPLYRTKSQQQRKHGYVFCDRKCKEAAQKDTSFGISPPHYGIGNGKYTYRALAFENYPHKCDECGYDKRLDVLQVHHQDHDRENNNLDNLRILCPTCHVGHHIDCKRTL